MSSNSWEQPTEEQLRQIISNYLDEVLRCYKEQQQLSLEHDPANCGPLEAKASELLEALMTSLEAGERRKAVMQVLCRANQFGEPILPS